MGDFWSRLQFLLRQVAEDDCQYVFHCNTSGRKTWICRLLALIDYPYKDRIRVTTGKTGKQWNETSATYSCEYYPTYAKWSSPKDKKVAYTFDANWKKDLKIPSWIPDLEASSIFQSSDTIKLGLPMQIEDVVEILSECLILVSVDNGLAHIARSVGCPHIMIEHEWGLERGFPSTIYNYTVSRSLEETIDLIGKYV